MPGEVAENYEEMGYDLHSSYKLKEYDELKELLKYHLSTLNIEGCILPGYELDKPTVQAAPPVSASAAPFDGGTAVKGTKPIAVQLGADLPDDDAPAKASPLAKAAAAKAVQAQVAKAQVAKAPVQVGVLSDSTDIDAMMSDILGT